MTDMKATVACLVVLCYLLSDIKVYIFRILTSNIWFIELYRTVSDCCLKTDFHEVVFFLTELC